MENDSNPNTTELSQTLNDGSYGFFQYEGVSCYWKGDEFVIMRAKDGAYVRIFRDRMESTIEVRNKLNGTTYAGTKIIPIAANCWPNTWDEHYSREGVLNNLQKYCGQTGVVELCFDVSNGEIVRFSSATTPTEVVRTNTTGTYNSYGTNNTYGTYNTYGTNSTYSTYNTDGTARAASTEKMPSVGGHLTMVIFGFIFGVLWGLLALGPFKRMKEAVEYGAPETAWENARKVKKFFFIGLGVNVLVLISRIVANQ